MPNRKNTKVSFQGNELKEILDELVKSSAPGQMTRLSEGKWHQQKITLTKLVDGRLHVLCTAKRSSHLADIQVDLPVGISCKHHDNKVIFETTVTDFDPSANSPKGGTISLALPDRIEMVEKRGYVRVTPPEALSIKVMFWHRGYDDNSTDVPTENYWQGQLVNLSASGMQIGIAASKELNFDIGQFIGIQFTPMAYQKPFVLEGQIRHIIKAHDGSTIRLGVQILGLEANTEGRDLLHKLVDVVQHYFDMNEAASNKQTTDES